MMIGRGQVVKDVTEALGKEQGMRALAEVQASVEVAVDAALAAYGNGEEFDDAFVENAAALVHEAWLMRNREEASEEEQRPYAELSEDTKEKDRRFVRAAIQGLYTRYIDKLKM